MPSEPGTPDTGEKTSAVSIQPQAGNSTAAQVGIVAPPTNCVMNEQRPMLAPTTPGSGENVLCPSRIWKSATGSICALKMFQAAFLAPTLEAAVPLVVSTLPAR